MASNNDITGDKLVSKPTNDQFLTGWDLIWGNKEDKEEVEEEVAEDVGC